MPTEMRHYCDLCGDRCFAHPKGPQGGGYGFDRDREELLYLARQDVEASVVICNGCVTLLEVAQKKLNATPASLGGRAAEEPTNA